jgi:hypothetical protein
MMQQDPKKGAKDYEKPSVKQKLAQSSSKKKVGVGEMGKPDFKAGFEAAMQKERNTVLNRAKERDKDPDWYKKEAVREALSRGSKERLTRFVKDVREDYPTPNVEEFRGWMNKQKKSAASELNRKSEIIKAMKPLKSMSKPKGKY